MGNFTYKNMVFFLVLKVLLLCSQFFLSGANPSAEPSISIKPTMIPSIYPTRSPTLTPSTVPSQTPSVKATTIDLRSIESERISITMSVVDPLDESGIQWFQLKLEEYIQRYFENDIDIAYVRLVNVDVRVTEMDPSFGTTSNDGILKITYDQSNSYQLFNEDKENLVTESLFVIDPLNSLRKRQELVRLMTLDDGSGRNEPFSGLVQVSEPIIYKSSGVSTAIIVGASVGAVALIALLGIFFYCRKKKRDQFYNQDAADYNPKNMAPGHVQLPVLNDEISTLDDPSPQYGVFQSNKSLQGYGNRSIGTMDPDYVGVYGGAADASIVSSAGGTLGDATRQSGKSILPGMTQGGSVFTDDEQSFEAFRNRNKYNDREEVLEIFAPSGKLGVVIDTPNSGAPVVYNIKDTCPIADKLRIGDRLIAVDDEDVTSMTAVKVSKVISQKSANPQRKFTIVRSIEENR
jgi:hypothetical protein